MSKSYHVTIKNFRRKTKEEIDEMANDPHSELHEWAEKARVKNEIKKQRKINKERN